MKNRRRVLALLAVVVIVAAGCDVVRVSVSNTGAQANGPSRNVALSGNANIAAFDSDASNLVPNDTNGVTDVFVRNAATQDVELVSVSTTGGVGNGGSSDPVISGDGRYVAFRSYATNLIVGAPPSGIYLRDRTAATTVLVNRDSSGTVIPAFTVSNIAMDTGSRFVVFVGDMNVWRYDRFSGYATKVLDDAVIPRSISRDGRYLAVDKPVFLGVHTVNVAVVDLATGAPSFIAQTDSTNIAMTPGARWAVYAYRPSCWPSGFPTCTAGPSGVRLRNLMTGEDTPVLTSLGVPPMEVPSLALSDDGQRVAVETAGNTYLYVRSTGAFTLVSAATNQLETGNAPSGDVAISGDGGTVGFSSAATNLVANDTNGFGDIFTRRL